MIDDINVLLDTYITNSQEAQELKKQLEDILEKCNQAYYNDNHSLLTDVDYDALKQHLLQLIQQYFPEEFKDENAVINQVGAKSSGDLKVQQHYMPMLSLDNAFEQADVEAFFNRASRFLRLDESTAFTCTSELKIDGVSLSLIYQDAKLQYARTRGDGRQGENVLHNVLTITDIPQQLASNISGILEIRGEIYITKADFLAINQQREQDGQNAFINPRNLASGSLRHLDAKESAKRPLRFFAWGFGRMDFWQDQTSFYNNYLWLQQLGFPINQHTRLCYSVAELMQHYNKINQLRYELPYEIDGMVYKIDNLTLQQRLGEVDRAPRWAIAHKFSAQTAITKINAITNQIGRSGIITPVAELEPVNLGGVLIKRASLHNYKIIQDKDIRIGDEVIIKRAGDVIPHIQDVLLGDTHDALPKVMPPSYCSVCNSLLVKDEDSLLLYCQGGRYVCKDTAIAHLMHCYSKLGFNIEGLSEKSIVKLYDMQLLQYTYHIFEIKYHKDQLLNVAGFGEIWFNKLIHNIEQAKNINFENFIYALGIKGVAEKWSKSMAKIFKSLDNLLTIAQQEEHCYQQLMNIDGIGDVVARDIIQFFQNKQHLKVIQQLLQYVVIRYNNYDNINNHALDNKNIIFTGALATLSRHEAKILAERSGANVLSTISKNIDYVVIGDKAGSKLTKAQQLSLTIISEDDFLQLLDH